MENKNKRKDKIIYRLWLTKAEEISLKESLKLLEKECTSQELGYAISNITEIIQNTYERGDFNKI